MRAKSLGSDRIDRHVLVTGGSRSLGLAIVKRLLSSDYAVTAVSRTTTKQVNDLQHQYRQALRIVEADLSDTDRLPEIIGGVAECRPIFGLINNAALAVSGLLVTLDAKAIDRMIGLNLTATILLSRLVAKYMIRARCGRIINISSVAAKLAYPGLTAYGATKAGLEGFTRTLARELGRRQITVNAIAPGFMETDMSAALSLRQRERIRNRTPLGRLVKPEDVAELVAFLLSPSAEMITGTVITIDGGASL